MKLAEGRGDRRRINSTSPVFPHPQPTKPASSPLTALSASSKRSSPDEPSRKRVLYRVAAVVLSPAVRPLQGVLLLIARFPSQQRSSESRPRPASPSRLLSVFTRARRAPRRRRGEGEQDAPSNPLHTLFRPFTKVRPFFPSAVRSPSAAAGFSEEVEEGGRNAAVSFELMRSSLFSEAETGP